MRRFAIVFLFAMVLTASWGTSPGTAIVGPDPDSAPPEFIIVLLGRDPDGVDRLDELHFFRADGWDFGDREGYDCATVEYIIDDAVALELTFEHVLVPGQDPNYVAINDKHGMEHEAHNPGPGFDHCGMAPGTGPRPPDGTDHFPHHTMLHFGRDGAEFAMLDLMRDGCAKAYWVPGDEAGEAWLWWDEDGPLSDGHHDLNCGGGAIEPAAVVRLWVSFAADGISFCTMDSLDGDRCSEELESAASLAHASAVSLRLAAHLRASGDVEIADDTFGCDSGRTVVIERRASGTWRRVGRDNTAGAGHFSLALPDRSGTYRARVLQATLPNGDTCESATSERRTYERRRG